MDRQLSRRNLIGTAAAALTEADHLGNVAYHVGKKLVWDAAKLCATNTR